MENKVRVILIYLIGTSLYTISATNKPIILSESESDVEKVVYLFAHGLAATHRQATSMFAYLTQTHPPFQEYNQEWIVKNPLVVFDFSDALNDEKIQWRGEFVNLGQELDMSTLHEAYATIEKEYPDRGVIGVGPSRGGVVHINYAAIYQPKNLKALVLESPFDTILNVITHLLKQYYLNWLPFSEALAIKYLKSSFPLLDVDGIMPQDVITRISFEIPILFVHSKRDGTVPLRSSRALYLQLRSAGHSKVHLFEIATGEHARILKGPEKKLYHQLVQAFYKTYNLPCEEEAAREGMKIFAYCQPSVEEVKKRIKKEKKRNLKSNIQVAALHNSIRPYH